jgi:hypothetical protein
LKRPGHYDDLLNDPHLNSAELRALVRNYGDEDPVPVAVVTGGSSRPEHHARLGSLHRKGNVVYQRIIFPRSSNSARMSADQLRLQQQDYTAQQIENMLLGIEKIPAGLPRSLLNKAFDRLSQREDRLLENHRRFNRLARRAKLEGVDPDKVRTGSISYDKRQHTYVQTFWFPPTLPAPAGARQTEGGAKVSYTADQINTMLRKPKTIPQGLDAPTLKGRLTLLEQHNRKNADWKHRNQQYK